MVDITIRGAGIFGLSTAWACAKRGASVQVIDPFGPGAGSSGGVVGALAPHVPENWNVKKAFQLDSLLMAEKFWADVMHTGGKNPGYVRSGRLQPILSAAALDLAYQRAAGAQTLWQGRAVWQVERAAEDHWSPITPTGWVIRDSLSALLHPRQAIDALVAALKTKGVAVVREGSDDGSTLWATGVAGLADLTRTHHRLVGNGIKGQAAVLAHGAIGAPQLFVDGLHVIPHLNGTVAVGSTTEREYHSADTTDAQLDAVIDKVRAALPVLRDAAVIQRWAGVRPRARSRAPMLGRWPDREGHFIANGGFKIGFGMAPRVAEVMADLMLDGRDEIPADFAVAASF